MVILSGPQAYSCSQAKERGLHQRIPCGRGWIISERKARQQEGGQEGPPLAGQILFKKNPVPSTVQRQPQTLLIQLRLFNSRNTSDDDYGGYSGHCTRKMIHAEDGGQISKPPVHRSPAWGTIYDPEKKQPPKQRLEEGFLPTTLKPVQSLCCLCHLTHTCEDHAARARSTSITDRALSYGMAQQSSRSR